jgi:hypothetical protein
MKIPFFSSGHAVDKYRHGESPFALVTGSSGGQNLFTHACQLPDITEQVLERN